MIIDCLNAARTRDFVDPGCDRRLSDLQVQGITLGGAIELACAGSSWPQRDHPAWHSWLTQLTFDHPHLQLAERAMSAAIRRDPLTAVRADVDVEMHGFSSRDDLGDNWDNVQENFVKRAQACGFGRDFAYALTAAFEEMVGNVWDHSAPRGDPMAPALLGYHVIPGEVHFAVGDIGRGALVSLHDNPRWSSLPTSTAALEAILRDNATRKASEPTGGGFRQVWKSFLDRGGTVFLSSGDGYARGFNDGARTLESGFLRGSPGFRFSASCFLRGVPGEKPLK